MPEEHYPERYEVEIKPLGADCVLVEARIWYRWIGGPLDGKVLPSPIGWIGPHPSHRYVREPCWLFRLFGDTLERRIERAKRSVSRWAEKELAGERRMLKVARQTVR